MTDDAQLAARSDLIRRVAAKFVRHHGWLEFDDAYQIVSLAAWKELRNRGGDVNTRIACAGERRMLDELRSGRVTGVTRAGRRHGVTAALSLTDRSGDGRAIEDTITDEVSDFAVHVEDELIVDSAIAALDERLRLVVYLRYYEDLPVADIADILGVTSGRVSQLLSDAHQRMRPLLAA